MRRASYFLAVLIGAYCFYSCQSYRVVGVEMYKPSTVTFPPEIKTVMIVNNAAQQPDNFGHRFVNQDQDANLSVSVDSMAYLFCLSLGKAIAESPLFDDVRLYTDTVRRDSVFHITKPFSTRDVEQFCDEHGVDALITLDQLIFKTQLNNGDSSPLSTWQEFNIWEISNYKNIVNIWYILYINVTGELTAIWPGENVAFTIRFADSLVWRTDFHDRRETISVQDVQYGIRYLSEYSAQKMHIHFVPNWIEGERWYYTSINSDWKRAAAYAAAEKWEAAGELWLPLFNKATKKSRKVRLASNLALVNEITGDFSKAVEFAAIADSLLQEITDEDNIYRIKQREYLEELKMRLEDEKQLSKQLRE